MLCIQEELAQLSEIAGSPERLITELREVQLPNSNHLNSASNSNDAAIKCDPGSESIDSQRSSWVEGILGCMRPVWTMLSKAAINDKIKGFSSKLCKFSCGFFLLFFFPLFKLSCNVPKTLNILYIPLYFIFYSKN